MDSLVERIRAELAAEQAVLARADLRRLRCRLTFLHAARVAAIGAEADMIDEWSDEVLREIESVRVGGLQNGT